MHEYVVNLWFAGQTLFADVTLMIRAHRVLDVNDVAEGTLRLLGEYCASHVTVVDVVNRRSTTLTGVVLSV